MRLSKSKVLMPGGIALLTVAFIALMIMMSPEKDASLSYEQAVIQLSEAEAELENVATQRALLNSGQPTIYGGTDDEVKSLLDAVESVNRSLRDEAQSAIEDTQTSD